MTGGSLAFVGAGSLGQAFTALLARSGQPVTLLASPRTADALRSARAIRLRGAVTADVPVGALSGVAGVVMVTADPRDLPRGAGIVFVTKGHQLVSAARAVRAGWPAAEDGEAWVAGFQNGLVKDDVLAEVFGPARVVGGVTILGAERRPDGEVAVAALGATYLGELTAASAGPGAPAHGPAEGSLAGASGALAPSARARAAVERLRAAGIPAEAPGDIRSVLWSKAANAAGVFGVSVLTRASGPRLFRTPDLLRAYLPLVRETVAIAAAHGVPVGDYTNFPIRSYVSRPDEETVATLSKRNFLAPSSARGVESIPSMTQDFLAGRGIEVDEVFGDLVDRAERAGVAAPRLRLVRDLLRGVDPGRQPA